MENDLVVGEFYEGVLLETFRPEEKVTRPRVRPVEILPRDILVEFPRPLREENPIGTRFRATVKVCQKTKGNAAHGRPYLRAETDTIEKVEEFRVNRKLFAVLRPDSISRRAYSYLYDQIRIAPDPLSGLRAAAYAAAKDLLDPRIVNTTARDRSDTIRKYALARSNGVCEGCEKDAPFITKNGQPYLEVHHIVAVARGGSDSPKNVAAICPNCHRRVEHGSDGQSVNDRLLAKIGALESRM